MSTSEQQGLVTPPGPRRKVAAVMFADMVGYSQRLEVDEATNSEQVTRSIDLFRSLISHYGGAMASVAGDGILALFESSERALSFAIQMRSEFREQAVWGDGEPIEFRIGLNLGEVTVSDANVIGHCVNVAARLQALAAPGEILVTDRLRMSIGDEHGVSFRSMGQPTLKNMSEPVEVFAVEQSISRPDRRIEILRNAPSRAPEPTRQPSVAVLALRNLSDDPANDHLCEGIVEDVIANLSRFRNLMVIARHSAFLFNLKTQTVREVGTRLGVRYLLGGSLRRAGKRLRVAVQLTGAELENVLWSDRFEIGIDELFELQDEIAGAVASRLAVQIDFAQQKQESQYPRDMRAYGLVLRGHQLVQRYTKEANAHARLLFDEALGFSRNYGRAYGGLSRTHNLDWRYSWSAKPNSSLDAAVDLAQKAIQLDPLDARGFAELGFAMLYQKRHEESLAEYSRAVVLNPNDADILAELADALVYAGQPRKSIDLLTKAMRLNPYYPDWYLWYLADAHNAMGNSAEVISVVRQMQNQDEGRRLLAANYAHLGQLDKASIEANEVLRLHPGFTISQWRQRPPYRDQAILERYVEGLIKAGLPK
jgi:TolB-like protein/class 3 adenylate cyclase/Flp pilus assembly protein TadD